MIPVVQNNDFLTVQLITLLTLKHDATLTCQLSAKVTFIDNLENIYRVNLCDNCFFEATSTFRIQLPQFGIH